MGHFLGGIQLKFCDDTSERKRFFCIYTLICDCETPKTDSSIFVFSFFFPLFVCLLFCWRRRETIENLVVFFLSSLLLFLPPFVAPSLLTSLRCPLPNPFVLFLFLFGLGNNELEKWIELKRQMQCFTFFPPTPQLKITLCCAISIVQSLVCFPFLFVLFVCLSYSLQCNLCMPMDGLTVDTLVWWRHGSAFIQHSAIMIRFIFVLCM